jgi:prepilin-type N-terminal cleavage/methylation domain-containing protein
VKSNPMIQRKARAGFTLIEVTVSSALFLVLSYGLLMATSAMFRTHGAVLHSVSDNRMTRSCGSLLTTELRDTTESAVTITTLADGNHELSFMQPIDAGGSLDWGVHDPTLGPDEESQNQPDWRIRYTVRTVPDGGNPPYRELLRQIVDIDDVVRKEKIIVKGLRSGTDSPPGFTVNKTGDLWEISLATVANDPTLGGRHAVFHVRMRN